MAAVGTAVRSELDGRVVKAAETALADHQFVTAIDIMVGMGWLTTPQIDRWRQGRVDYLERLVTASPSKISTSMTTFHHWARNEGLTPSETAYLARSRDHRSLRFSKSGDPGTRAPTEPTGSARSSPRRRSHAWRRNRAGLPIWSSSHHSRNGAAGNAPAPATCCSWRVTDPCASSVRTSTTWSSCPRVTRHSPGGQRRP